MTMGLLNFVHTTIKMTVDLVPCDYVSNGILAATVYTAIEPSAKLNIIHISSSNVNPVTMKMFGEIMLDHVKYNPYTKQIMAPSCLFVNDKRVYNIYKQVYQNIPLKMMTIFSKLPVFGSKELKEKVKMFTEAKEKLDNMQEIFTYFLTV